MKTLMEMFGHKNIAVTDKYVATTPALQGDAARKIDDALRSLRPLPSAS